MNPKAAAPAATYVDEHFVPATFPFPDERARNGGAARPRVEHAPHPGRRTQHLSLAERREPHRPACERESANEQNKHFDKRWQLPVTALWSLCFARGRRPAFPRSISATCRPSGRAAICLPDDPYKSLVDKSGELLYHYRQGGREFATRIAVEVTAGAVWKKQELLSPRVPIVRTYRAAPGLEIVEEAFAVTDDTKPPAGPQRPGPGTRQEHRS